MQLFHFCYTTLMQKHPITILAFSLLFLAGCAATPPPSSSSSEGQTSSKQAQNTTVEYRIVEEKDISYAGCRRVTFKIIVPDDADKTALNNTMKTIVDKYKSGWDDITVWAYRFSEENDLYMLPYTKGMKEYSSC